MAGSQSKLEQNSYQLADLQLDRFQQRHHPYRWKAVIAMRCVDICLSLLKVECSELIMMEPL